MLTEREARLLLVPDYGWRWVAPAEAQTSLRPPVTSQRISDLWERVEAERSSSRTSAVVAGLTFAAQLAPQAAASATERQPLRPLKWGTR